jgi:flagellar hook-basal body complex protein FliE
MAIDPISTATLALVQGGQTPAAGAAAGTTDATGSGLSFGDLIGNVEHADTDANTAVSRMLDGSGDVHEAMIALQRADVMLQLTVQIRNKLVAAYQDVIRMPI